MNNSLKAAHNNSYARLNITQTHANGWVVVMLKKGVWQALDANTLHNTKDGYYPPTARAYLKAHIDLEFMPIIEAVDDNLDMFGDLGFDLTEDKPRTVKEVHDVNVYEFAVVGNIDDREFANDELEAINIVATNVLRETAESSDYLKRGELDMIAMPVAA